jgi:hypothetical protein
MNKILDLPKEIVLIYQRMYQYPYNYDVGFGLSTPDYLDPLNQEINVAILKEMYKLELIENSKN